MPLVSSDTKLLLNAHEGYNMPHPDLLTGKAKSFAGRATVPPGYSTYIVQVTTSQAEGSRVPLSVWTLGEEES